MSLCTTVCIVICIWAERREPRTSRGPAGDRSVSWLYTSFRESFWAYISSPGAYWMELGAHCTSGFVSSGTFCICIGTWQRGIFSYAVGRLESIVRCWCSYTLHRLRDVLTQEQADSDFLVRVGQGPKSLEREFYKEIAGCGGEGSCCLARSRCVRSYVYSDLSLAKRARP